MRRSAALLGLLLVALALPTRRVEADGEVPHDAIRIDRAQTLRTPGAYFLLTQDVRATDHGFVIAAKGITLDLGGHTVTYGTAGRQAHGVTSKHQYHEGTIRVRCGRLVQAAGAGKASHGLDIEGGHDLRIEDLGVEVHGPDACGIHVYGAPTGSVAVRRCEVACRTTTVSDRHYPGVAAIRLEDVHVDTEITDNRVTASPQWGIQVAGKGAETRCRIARNAVAGTRALVANGYMLGIHRRNVEAFDNVLEGESRGIHVDGVDHEGHGARIHHNRIVAQDQPNAEFDPHWCHGIKLEDSRDTVVHHNFVRVTADHAHSEARALDLDARSGGPLHVYANRFEGLSTHPGRKGIALVWSGLERGRPQDVVVEHNAFVATDVLVQRTWHSDRGTRFRANAWLEAPHASAVLFERFDNRDGRPSPGHGFLDPHAPGGTTAASEWAEPGPYASTRERTIRLVLRDGPAPLAGAEVRVRDRERRIVHEATADAAGIADVRLVVSRLTNGPLLDYRGPFTFEVTPAAGGTALTARRHLRGPAVVRLDRAAGTAARVAATPGPPVTLVAVRHGPGRARLRWSAPAAGADAARYVVEVDGSPWLLAGATEAELGGLPAAALPEIRVRAIGFDGSLSPPSAPARRASDDG